jgi:protease-4
MALNADTLLDRIYLKNQARRWRMIALVLGLISLLVLVGKSNDFGSQFEGDHIARLTIDDVIDDDTKRHDLLMEIAEDDQVKALILRMDSPGGGTVGSEQIYLDLREIAKKKPVICTMRSYATSGGYLAAIGADYILAREGTLTGSIGVIMQTAEVTSLAEKLGIKPITVKSGNLKATPNPFESFGEKDRAVIQGIINEFYDYFLDLVKTRRKMTDEQIATIADGRVVSARTALKLKMIDAIGGDKEALEWLKAEHQVDPSLEIFDKKVKEDKPTLESLLEGYATKIFKNNMLVKLDGLVSIWQPAGLR